MLELELKVECASNTLALCVCRVESQNRKSLFFPLFTSKHGIKVGVPLRPRMCVVFCFRLVAISTSSICSHIFKVSAFISFPDTINESHKKADPTVPRPEHYLVLVPMLALAFAGK